MENICSELIYKSCMNYSYCSVYDLGYYEYVFFWLFVKFRRILNWRNSMIVLELLNIFVSKVDGILEEDF